MSSLFRVAKHFYFWCFWKIQFQGYDTVLVSINLRGRSPSGMQKPSAWLLIEVQGVFCERYARFIKVEKYFHFRR